MKDVLNPECSRLFLAGNWLVCELLEVCCVLQRLLDVMLFLLLRLLTC